MKKVIITGADGFIGRHLVEYLLEKGIEVWAIVHPESPKRDIFISRENVCTVCATIPELSNYIERFPYDADAFYHFAWQGVDADSRDDFSLQIENIKYSLESIKFASEIRAKRIIIPGSTSEYLYCGGLINGTTLPTPQNAYGSIKVALRYLAFAYAKQLGIDMIYTVITGIYAADRKDNNVIYYTIEKLLEGEKPSLTKLEQLWDYIYIDDVVEALFLVAEKGKNGKIYAIGKGDNRPLRDYIESIRDCINPKLPLGIGEIAYSNERMPSSCIDLTEIQRDVGFIPKVDFLEGIRKVIFAMKEEKGLE